MAKRPRKTALGGGLVATILTLLTAYYFGSGQINQPSQSNSAEFKPNQIVTDVKLVGVVDGDTIKLELGGKTQSVRLIGIDTPESVHPDASKNTPEGKVASEYTKSLLQNTKTVKIEFDAEPYDKYKRPLVYVWLPDGKMLQELIAKDGYAKQMTIAPNVKYADRFKAAVADARNKGLGLWKQK